VRRTQSGNNNAYCQDNETSWFDWALVERHRDLFRFWKLMIEFRKRHAALYRGQFLSGTKNERGLSEVAWHGTKLDRPGWQDPAGRALALTLAGFDGDDDIHIMMNMHWESLDFELPVVPGRLWLKALDTFQASPFDIADFGAEVPVVGNAYNVKGRSIVALVNCNMK
jgi:glycogen operon protein